MSTKQIWSEVNNKTGEITEGPMAGFRMFSSGEQNSIIDKNGNKIPLSYHPQKTFLKKENGIYKFYMMWKAKDPTARIVKYDEEKKDPFG